MTGIKAPVGALGATAAVAHGTLPYTGLALELYVGAGAALVVAGIALRLLGRSRTAEPR
jgi:hypothetical protein